MSALYIGPLVALPNSLAAAVALKYVAKTLPVKSNCATGILLLTLASVLRCRYCSVRTFSIAVTRPVLEALLRILMVNLESPTPILLAKLVMFAEPLIN